MNDPCDLTEGARNLLRNCAELKAGETLLIVAEHPHLGWYDEAAPHAVAAEARSLGIEPTILAADKPGSGANGAVMDAVTEHACTVFFARIGDQDRFATLPPGRRSVMVYARDATALGSAYGCTDHRAMAAVKRAINAAMGSARTIEVTCPLGTRIIGAPPVGAGPEPEDVAVRRFPMAVPAPMSAAGFSGRVILEGWLTSTGSQPYEPDHLRMDGRVEVELDEGRIKQFIGDRSDVDAISRHYNHVSTLFGIDKDAVHSWHAGMHPACFYDNAVDANPDRWSNNIFGSPRYLHFHTCGDYAPGEICWMVRDATVSLDGVHLWEDGRILMENFKPTADCLGKHPELGSLFDRRETRIGS